MGALAPHEAYDWQYKGSVMQPHDLPRQAQADPRSAPFIEKNGIRIFSIFSVTPHIPDKGGA